MTDGLEATDGTILVVCTGNVCRSPYIERRLSAALGETSIAVSSAGTGALVGSEMDPRVARRLSELGLTSEGFVARQLTPEMARAADLILGATREHRSSIVRMEPSVLRRTYALADFSDLAAYLAGRHQTSGALRAEAPWSFVRRVSQLAALGRDEVRARTVEEAEIVDPFRRSDKMLERMIQQADTLLDPIVSVFASSYV